MAVEETESLLHVAGVDPANWVDYIPRWFGHLYAVADVKSYLTSLVLDAMSAANWSGRPHPHWEELVDWSRGSSPVDLVRLRERIDEVIQWPPLGSPTYGLLKHARQLLVSPGMLRKRLLLDVGSFKRVIARSVRLRNAIAHGGYVERGGLATCVSQVVRSATQLTVEILEAFYEGTDPQEYLINLRNRYIALVDSSGDDPEAVLRADHYS